MNMRKNKLLQVLVLVIFVGISLVSCEIIVGDADEKLIFSIPTWLIGHWSTDGTSNGGTKFTFTSDDIIYEGVGKFSEEFPAAFSEKENEVSNATEYAVTVTGGKNAGRYIFKLVSALELNYKFESAIGNNSGVIALKKY